MSDNGFQDLVQPGAHPCFDQIRVRPNGRLVVIWQKLGDGWRLTRVDSDGRVGQATGTNRTKVISQARAAMH